MESKLTGLHLLFTYKCVYQCDHCFVWGGPRQPGVMTLEQVQQVYDQAEQLGTIDEIYLEGGEPMLYYPVVLEAAREAKKRGFGVGMVSNNYWATSVDDALVWLRPFAGLVDLMELSTDLFHADELISAQAKNAQAAAQQLGIPVSTIVCETPADTAGRPTQDAGQPVQSGAILFKGRAAEQLVEGLERKPWRQFDACPGEELEHPRRVHLDYLGNLHICQGIPMGNLWERPLAQVVADYEARTHPVIGPLLEGGPAALVERHGLDHAEHYVDACHLCFEARKQLRRRFPGELKPDQMYGEPTDQGSEIG